jgi:membrane protease YdiL (CAAX protease family)
MEQGQAMAGPFHYIVGVLADIDKRAAQARQKEEGLNGVHLWTVLATVALCLLMLHYLKYTSSLLALVEWWGGGEAVWALRRHPSFELITYIWWGAWHLLCFLLIPFAVVRYGLKRRLSEFGWQWGEVHRHWPGYLLLLLPVSVFAVLASFREDFAAHYPFYGQAGRSWSDLLAWEAIYILQFIGVEFFFRGFLLNALRIPLGSLSIAVMCLPYLMLHFPKPWLEATGAIGFGFFLGILALQSRSIWGGVLVHVGVALSMDMAALWQAGRIPAHW